MQIASVNQILERLWSAEEARSVMDSSCDILVIRAHSRVETPGLIAHQALGRKKPRCLSEIGMPSFSITTSMSSHSCRFTPMLPPLCNR